MFPFLFPSLSLSLLFLKTMFSSLLLLINGLTIPQGPTVFSKGEFIETNIFYEGRRWLNPFFSLFFFRPRSRSCHSSWDSEIHRDEGTRKYRRLSSVLWNLSIIPYSKYSVWKEYTILPPTSPPLPSLPSLPAVIFSYAHILACWSLRAVFSLAITNPSSKLYEWVKDSSSS